MKIMRLIDADELIKAFEDAVCIVPIPYDFIKRIIENAPTVPLPDFKEGYKQAIIDGKTNVAIPQGEWITSEKLREVFYICSNCKEISCCKGKFCPDCGADMRGNKE